MLKRCYGRLAGKFNPSYANTCVCEAWLTFSLFYAWALKKEWKGKELDKDLLGDGTIYSPDTCCFISGELNKSLRVPCRKEKTLPTGVRVHRQSKHKYCAEIRIGKNKSLHLGYFDSVQDAENAYKEKKIEILVSLAEKESDKRIMPVLISKYK